MTPSRRGFPARVPSRRRRGPGRSGANRAEGGNRETPAECTMAFLGQRWRPLRSRSAADSVYRYRRSAQRLHDSLLETGRLTLLKEPGGRLLASWRTEIGLTSCYVGSPEFAEAVTEFAATHGWPPLSSEVIYELEDRLALENPVTAPYTPHTEPDRWKADVEEPEPAAAPPASVSLELATAGPEPVTADSLATAPPARPSAPAPEWDESVLPVEVEPEPQRLERALRNLARGGAWIGRPSSLALAVGDDPFSVAEALVRNHATLSDRGLRVLTRNLSGGWVWVVIDEGFGLVPNLPTTRVRPD
jgi:hypothetical protein